MSEEATSYSAEAYEAGRAQIAASVLKIDHFQGIYRLERVLDGAPNFRKAELDVKVFGTGQPTLSGFLAILEHLRKEHGCDKVVWTCMRQEPIIYANDISMAPRAKHNLNENMEFENVTGDLVEVLQTQLVTKARDECKVDMHVHFFQDTFAENPADRINHELTEPIDDISNVRSLTETYAWLREAKGFDVSLARVPIADEMAPTPGDFDTLVTTLKPHTGPGTALVFNCQMGKGRTTTGMVCAVLISKALRGEFDKLSEEDEAKRAAKCEAGDIDDSLGDPTLAEYGVIRRLVQTLPHGSLVKAETDAAIGACHHMQNLRDVINYTKEKYDSETEERRVFWKRMSINFIERYFYLICFQSYLRDNAHNNFDKTFTTWVHENQHVVDILGTREAGALKEFAWQ